MTKICECKERPYWGFNQAEPTMITIHDVGCAYARVPIDFPKIPDDDAWDKCLAKLAGVPSIEIMFNGGKSIYSSVHINETCDECGGSWNRFAWVNGVPWNFWSNL